MKKSIVIILMLALAAGSAVAQRVMENLNRGTVALQHEAGKVTVCWRILGNEPKDIAFDLYRSADGSTPVKLNARPLTGATFFVDSTADLTRSNAWTVHALAAGRKTASPPCTLPANPPVRGYIPIPMKTPAGYSPNDCSAADLDGDGEYEIIVHQAGRGRDNPSNGFADAPILQAYKLDGTMLWEINLGTNIREGAHYTQFMVYDLDGDGRAELACKTADGTRDGQGKAIGNAGKDWRNPQTGKILDGPEYFTIFDGRTGAALATADYIPSRYPTDGWGGVGGNAGNDNNGNRVDRFLACVAYLDGKLPSVVMCRGYYGRSVLAAWDWRNGKLTSRWVFDSKDGRNPYSGQGYHTVNVADVDNDGRDEIVYGAMVVDDNGQGLYTTGFRHGDALHVGDLMPDRPGLEVFGVHENEANVTGPGATVFDARNGQTIWRGLEGKDVGRGVAEDIYEPHPGAEMWFSGSGGLLTMTGERIGDSPTSTNFLIWWDGLLTRQLLDRNRITRYGQGVIFEAEGCSANNGSKATPALSADLLGDWREEVIFRTRDNSELRLFCTPVPTDYRFCTLMHDPLYRLSIATQNVGYNQPPHLSFWLGAKNGK